jgi:hypothetical protein
MSRSSNAAPELTSPSSSRRSERPSTGSSASSGSRHSRAVSAPASASGVEPPSSSGSKATSKRISVWRNALHPFHTMSANSSTRKPTATDTASRQAQRNRRSAA